MSPRGPLKVVERIVSIFIPPACREEVLGDFEERFRSPAQYAFDAIRTVPMVILSRVRRTSDPQVVLIQAFAFYLSFLGAAWFFDGELLRSEWGLIRLALPGAMAIVGVMLEDAYARPGTPRTGYALARGPVVGLMLAWITQAGQFTLPRWVMVTGCGMGLLLSTAIRILFPPMADQLQGANAPAYWLERAGAGDGIFSQNGIRILKVLAAVSAIAAVGTLVADQAALPKAQVFLILALAVAAVQLSKRG